jgi:hypothetical protein
MPQQIKIRCYQELNDFLPQQRRYKTFDIESKKVRSVKDLIESIGIPHTEIDLIFVDGESVDFSYQVHHNDSINVYPVFELLPEKVRIELLPLKPTFRHCQPPTLAKPRFVLDVHLGRLAAYLRMLGFDTLYKNDCDDPTLADLSALEQRILLTCDRLLLMRKQISYGYFVRSRQPHEQLIEVLSRYGLYKDIKPFTRCMHCNGNTRAVRKQDIATQLLPKTKKYYDEFYQCDSCKKVYWQGSHYLRMQDMINMVKDDAQKSLLDND